MTDCYRRGGIKMSLDHTTIQIVEMSSVFYSVAGI